MALLINDVLDFERSETWRSRGVRIEEVEISMRL